MFVIVWEFQVRSDQVERFVEGYGAEGEWAQLFRSAEEYRGTELLRSATDPTSFVTIDRWDDEDAFDAFEQRYTEPYRELDARFEACTVNERRIGVFVEA
jgi:heme-degrading monooxygenase HmoA